MTPTDRARRFRRYLRRRRIVYQTRWHDSVGDVEVLVAWTGGIGYFTSTQSLRTCIRQLDRLKIGDVVDADTWSGCVEAERARLRLPRFEFVWTGDGWIVDLDRKFVNAILHLGIIFSWEPVQVSIQSMRDAKAHPLRR